MRATVNTRGRRHAVGALVRTTGKITSCSEDSECRSWNDAKVANLERGGRLLARTRGAVFSRTGKSRERANPMRTSKGDLAAGGNPEFSRRSVGASRGPVAMEWSLPRRARFGHCAVKRGSGARADGGHRVGWWRPVVETPRKLPGCGCRRPRSGSARWVSQTAKRLVRGVVERNLIDRSARRTATGAGSQAVLPAGKTLEGQRPSRVVRALLARVWAFNARAKPGRGRTAGRVPMRSRRFEVSRHQAVAVLG